MHEPTEVTCGSFKYENYLLCIGNQGTGQWHVHILTTVLIHYWFFLNLQLYMDHSLEVYRKYWHIYHFVIKVYMPVGPGSRRIETTV